MQEKGRPKNPALNYFDHLIMLKDNIAGIKASAESQTPLQDGIF